MLADVAHLGELGVHVFDLKGDVAHANFGIPVFFRRGTLSIRRAGEQLEVYAARLDENELISATNVENARTR